MPNFFSNGSNQDNLVALMTPVIQTYHQAAKPSTKEANAAITVSIESLDKLISLIKKNIDIPEINPPQHNELDEKTKTLVDSMIPIIQTCYPLDATSPEKTKAAITCNIKPLHEFMGIVLAKIIQQQNAGIKEAMDAADRAPYCGY